MRIEPLGSVWDYQTYRIVAPLETHWRPATCAEVDCPHYLNGWQTILPVGSDLIPVLERSGRGFTRADAGPGLVAYRFAAGQVCFKASTHRMRTGRPEIFVRQDGDHRGNPTGQRVIHTRPLDWVEDFALHQDQVATEIERG